MVVCVVTGCLRGFKGGCEEENIPCPSYRSDGVFDLELPVISPLVTDTGLQACSTEGDRKSAGVGRPPSLFSCYLILIET